MNEGTEKASPPLVALIGDEVTIIDEERLTVALYNGEDVVVIDVTTDRGTDQAMTRSVAVALRDPHTRQRERPEGVGR